MKIKDIALSAAYVGQRVVKAICVGAQEIWSAVKYIIFADPVVEQICATNWGDGKGITVEQAAAVTDIGTVFQGNTEITSFDELEKFESIKYLGVWNGDGIPFKGCIKLKSVKIPKSVTHIYFSAFNGCTSLRSVSGLENVQTVWGNVFDGCPLEGTLHMPSLVECERFNLDSSKLEKITSAGSIVNWKIYLKNVSTLVQCIIPPTVTRIGVLSFSGCVNLEDIGNNLANVVSIGSEGFKNTKSLKNPIDLSNTTSIGYEAFSNSGITGVLVIGASSIGRAAFKDCTNLTSVKLLNSVTTLANSVFEGCSKLEKFLVEAELPPTISSYVFNNTPIATDTGSIYVPDQSVTAYREASGWLDYADRIKPLSQYVES